MGEIERERGRERKLINVSIEKKKIVICVARASMVLFSLGEINKNIPGNFERSLTSNTLYQHLCKSPSPQVTQAWIRIPFNPTFRTFHWSNETECIFNWSDRNIGDQLWRWSTLTGLVGPNWQNCYPQYRSFVSSLLSWLKKKSRIPSRGFRLSDDVTKHASSNRVHNVHLHIKNSKLFTSKWYKDRC